MAHSSSQTQKSPFTLLELLIVIGIMIIIVGLTIPAFRKMSSGNAVNASARMLMGQLNLARAAAIAEQNYIAVIMPGRYFDKPYADQKTSGDDTIDEYHFRAFRIGIVQKPSTTAKNKFELQQWYPDSTWKILPVGAVIAEANDSYKKDTKTDGVEIYGSTRLKNEINASGWLDASKLNGDTTDTSCWVIDGDEKLAKGKTNNSDKKNARCVVFSPKGRCCTFTASGDIEYVDRYITLVEGNVEASTANTFVLAEENIANMVIIKVSGTTGNSEYMKTETEE